ncbi:acyl-CoA/acyl-ACP dehydrogenase, partial [Acinetobacter baumannii]|uniref:acyl-CoA/acyl-ACP dehydrogenase n=1 Tax=Acinetobacter baumannii TaxID=470 RepID=UPI0013D7F6FB
IGRIEILLATNARLLASLGRDIDEGHQVGGDPGYVRHVVIDNAVAITELALELGGNPGISRNSPLERHHRDALTGRAHAPQNALIRV